jgi:hypothetical protein
MDDERTTRALPPGFTDARHDGSAVHRRALIAVNVSNRGKGSLKLNASSDAT